MIGAESVMFILAVVLTIAAAATLWHLDRDNDRAANVAVAVAVVIFVAFLFVQHWANEEAELKHAAEHRAVEEQVESIRDF